MARVEPELFILIGLALLIAGSVIAFIAMLRAFYGGWRPRRAVGVVFIGPLPIFIGGESSKILLAIALVSLAAFLMALLLFWGLPRL